MASTPVDCTATAAFADDYWLATAQVIQVALSATVVLLSMVLFFRKKLRQKAVHILFLNITILYCLVSLPLVVVFIRVLVIYRTYRDPCDLLVPPWMSIVVRAPYWIYVVGFPLWHLAIAVERSWATVRVQSYEKSSAAYGGICSTFVWTVSVGTVVYFVRLGFEDPMFSLPNVYVTITTATNASVMRNAQFVLLTLDVLCSVIDASLVLVNRRKMKKLPPQYSLSRNYQLNENVAVTMHLAIPLDVCNTVVYAIFLLLSTWVRSVVLLQLVMSLSIVIRFGMRAPTTPVIIAHEEHSRLYFSQFRNQIGTTGSLPS